MVSKEVLKRIGVFAVAAVVAVSPVLAVNANGGVQLFSADTGTGDPVTGDPVPPSTAPIVPPSTAPTAPPSTAPTVPPSTAPTTPPAETPDDSSGGSQEYVADVVTNASGTVIKTTVPGTYRATVVEGVAVTTPLAAVNAAFEIGRAHV